ncbi:hypothetical protein T4D_17136 [Trichinella pseudospiralis]|uniref:Uncharacterized protein n=1 Tax=Trichinella pseudospiralis TaxID=6337 RepID=A0A0V1FBS9_TRIPS|nr:hypothetical protein T4D_17136 [Trichinella pseudospiralis]
MEYNVHKKYKEQWLCDNIFNRDNAINVSVAFGLVFCLVDNSRDAKRILEVIMRLSTVKQWKSGRIEVKEKAEGEISNGAAHGHALVLGAALYGRFVFVVYVCQFVALPHTACSVISLTATLKLIFFISALLQGVLLLLFDWCTVLNI